MCCGGVACRIPRIRSTTCRWRQKICHYKGLRTSRRLNSILSTIRLKGMTIWRMHLYFSTITILSAFWRMSNGREYLNMTKSCDKTYEMEMGETNRWRFGEIRQCSQLKRVRLRFNHPRPDSNTKLTPFFDEKRSRPKQHSCHDHKCMTMPFRLHLAAMQKLSSILIQVSNALTS